MDAALERLLISVSESRAIPARHRQHQLQRLHESLVSAATTLNVAIAGDSPRHTPAEIEAEFSLATDAVRHFYDSIDVLAEHHDEYAVAHGKNNLNRRLPVGLVLIKPSKHTRLFSAVSAVAAAIAGGNCVILEVDLTKFGPISCHNMLNTYAVPYSSSAMSDAPSTASCPMPLAPAWMPILSGCPRSLSRIRSYFPEACLSTRQGRPLAHTPLAPTAHIRLPAPGLSPSLTAVPTLTPQPVTLFVLGSALAVLRPMARILSWSTSSPNSHSLKPAHVMPPWRLLGVHNRRIGH